MSRAYEDRMDALHGIVAQAYIEQITAALASGGPISPALLTSAAKYLKDNGIDHKSMLTVTTPGLNGIANVGY